MINTAAKNTSKTRLLLNAEAFGFGPTAAIASFFPYLRARFQTIGYIGTGHTLDLQRNLGYDEIHDITQTNNFDDVCKKYDVFITALDFAAAKQAKDNGLRVIIYDPLAWYWKMIPQIAREADLYIVQDFIGVRERIDHEYANAIIVPPILQTRQPAAQGKKLLVNLGGLQNPILPKAVLVRYAKAIIGAIARIFPTQDLVVAVSSAIAKEIDLPYVRSYSRDEMITLLANTKAAYMTPGLGNMYDAAQYGIPTTWLPPTNDSQGQQAKMLFTEGLADGFIDWKDLDLAPVDYFADQQQALNQIRQRIESMQENSNTTKLEHAIRDRYPRTNKTRMLIERFGTNGAQMVADIINLHLRNQ